MADAPTWRQGYDALERQVGPRLESMVRSESFAVAVGVVARFQRAVQHEAGRTTRRLLHQLNLPAGSDVSRILNEIGQLRRQVRELAVELEETKEALAAARTTAAPNRAPQNRAPRTRGPQKRAPQKRAPRKRAPRERAPRERGEADGTDARA